MAYFGKINNFLDFYPILVVHSFLNAKFRNESENSKNVQKRQFFGLLLDFFDFWTFCLKNEKNQ